MNTLSVFQKHLPSGCELIHLPRGEMTLSLLRAQDEELGWGCHRDSRLADIEAVGRYLQKAIPLKLEATLVPQGAWAYAPQATQARSNAVLQAVHRWAWNLWQKGGGNLIPIEIEKELPLKTCQLWHPEIRKHWGWQSHLTLFENEAGIMNLHLHVLATQEEDGRVSLATSIARLNENNWVQTLAGLSWNRQLPKRADGALLQRLKQEPGFDHWPPIRVTAVQLYDLSQSPIEVPGHLCYAAIESEPQEEGPNA